MRIRKVRKRHSRTIRNREVHDLHLSQFYFEFLRSTEGSVLVMAKVRRTEYKIWIENLKKGDDVGAYV